MCPGITGLLLHGAAGIGKSVLALHIASRISTEHPGTRVATVSGPLTVEQLAALLVPDSPSLVVLDQLEANTTHGVIASSELTTVLAYLAAEITHQDARRSTARVIITARQPLALGPQILIRRVGPLTRWSADEFSLSLPRLGQLTDAEREHAWRLTAGHPGCLRSLDTRLADTSFAELADALTELIAARTGLTARRVFPTELDPADAAAIAAAVDSMLNPPVPEAVTAQAAAGTDAATNSGAVLDTSSRPDPDAGRRRHQRLLVLAAAVATAAVAWAPFAVRPLLAGTARPAAVAAPVPRTYRAGQAAPAPDAAAAAWLAANVTSGTLIGCDPGMCASLIRQGVGQPQLSPLSSGGDLAADGLIVTTEQTPTQLSAAITAAAPELAASFGTGSGRVEIREVTPGGASAYRQWRLAADMASRRNGGNLMLGNPSIKASGDTWVPLAMGHVDERILLALAEIAHSAPVTIAQFGATSPGAAPEFPMRSVLIDVANPAAAADYLKVQNPVMRPLAVRIGHASLWIEYGTPSPLGLFQATS
jgi:hypothetical protein